MEQDARAAGTLLLQELLKTSSIPPDAWLCFSNEISANAFRGSNARNTITSRACVVSSRSHARLSSRQSAETCEQLPEGLAERAKQDKHFRDAESPYRRKLRSGQ